MPLTLYYTDRVDIWLTDILKKSIDKNDYHNAYGIGAGPNTPLGDAALREVQMKMRDAMDLWVCSGALR